MNRDQLFINESSIDLSEGTLIAISSQINRLEDLVDHQSNYTNKFKVPRTKNNVQVLENSDRVQATTQIPYLKNSARLFKSGVEVVQNGFAIVDSTDTFFNITVYSGNVDFFDIIEKKKLSDLDLSDFDHTWDFNAVFDSRLHNADDGYKYSIINYGQLINGSRTIDPRDLRVCLYNRELFIRTIEQADFDWDGDFFSNAGFQKLLLTTDNDNKGSHYYDTLGRVLLGDRFSSPPAGVDAHHNFIFIRAGETWTFTFRIKYIVTSWVGGSSTLEFGWAGTNYVHPASNGTFDITLSVTTTAVVDGNFEIAMLMGDVYVEIVFSELTGQLSTSDEPDFIVHIQPCLNNSVGAVYVVYPGVDLKDQYGYTTVNIKRILPDWTQKEFIKAIAQMFGLMFKTSSKRNKIYIRQFSEIVDNIPIAKDWTNKLDMGKSESLDFRIPGYAQKNLCQYTHDDDDALIPDEYGDGKILVNDQTLASEKTTIKLPFAASLMDKKLINLDVPTVKRIDDDSGEWEVNNVPRILIDNTIDVSGDGNGPITYDDGVSSDDASTNTPVCYFKLESKTFNLGFDNSLLVDNYSSLTQILNKSKRVTAWFKLSPIDVYQFTEGDPDIEGHFVPIFLAQYSAVFYVSKIINYTGKGLTKVELIRIGTRNLGLLGKTRRYSMYDPDSYGQINRNWPAGDHIFTLNSMILGGIEYAHGDTMVLNAPPDLLAGLGLDGITNFVMNISDWITSLMPSGYRAYDDMNAIDVPDGATFDIRISYVDAGGTGLQGETRFTNEGVYWMGGAPSAHNTYYTSEIL